MCRKTVFYNMENSKVIDQYKVKSSREAQSRLCKQYPESNRRSVERKASYIIKQYQTLLKRKSEERLTQFLNENIDAPCQFINPNHRPTVYTAIHQLPSIHQLLQI